MGENVQSVPSILRLPVGYRVPLRGMSGRSPRHECLDVSDIRETFDQLDRRLGELRRQIAAIAQDPQPAAPLAPPPPRRLHAVPPPPPAAEPAAIASTLSGQPASVPQANPDVIASQIQQLMAVRDQLLAGTRELVRTYERQLDLLEQMTASELLTGGEALSAAVAAAPAPEPTVPLAAAPAPRTLFEGMVTVAVSGADRIQTIEVLQDALSRAPHVEQVYVRRCHRGQAWLELTLSTGTELLGDLDRVLPFPFAVTSASDAEIALHLEAGQ